MTEHKHAWFLRALAAGEPLENFERKSSNVTEERWAAPHQLGFGSIIEFPEQWQIRRKPRMIRIGAVEVQAGITEAPESGTKLWIADPTAKDFTFAYHWDGGIVDTQRLQRGLVHLAQKPAVAMGKALAALTEVK
jgi:hypothetical protein